MGKRIVLWALAVVAVGATADLAVTRIVPIVLLCFLVGTPHPDAGKWEDGPMNWNRAFHESQPTILIVVRSYRTDA